MDGLTDDSLNVWPEEGLEKIVACPVCTSKERSLLYNELKDVVFNNAPGEWCLYKCKGCGSAYLDPRPSEETIHLAYGHYYTHGNNDRYNFDEKSGYKYWTRAFANGYRNIKNGTNYSPENKIGGYFLGIVPGMGNIFDFEKRHLPSCQKGAKLLDVGFGSGDFLCLARDMGWDVTGVDVDPVTVQNSLVRGLNVHEGDIEAVANQANTFDVVTMNHVIEHVHNCHKVLAIAFKIIKPGGLVWLETPNIEALSHKIYRKNWRALEVPRHLVLYTWGALEMLLKKCGFKEVQRKVRTGVYPALSAMSRAARSGSDKCFMSKPKFQDHLMGQMLDFYVKFDYRKSDFITLIARKRL